MPTRLSCSAANEEFFDINKSRSIPPQRRPEASRLLAALAAPSRGFEAVVVGEQQRAFWSASKASSGTTT